MVPVIGYMAGAVIPIDGLGTRCSTSGAGASGFRRTARSCIGRLPDPLPADIVQDKAAVRIARFKRGAPWGMENDLRREFDAAFLGEHLARYAFGHQAQTRPDSDALWEAWSLQAGRLRLARISYGVLTGNVDASREHDDAMSRTVPLRRKERQAHAEPRDLQRKYDTAVDGEERAWSGIDTGQNRAEDALLRRLWESAAKHVVRQAAAYERGRKRHHA
jgi:hypothetical protein